MKKFLIAIVCFLLLIVISLLWINVYILTFSENKIVTNIDDLERKRVWLVLGAWVFSDGNVSNIFADRLDSAILAYQKGKIKEILVSWDNATKYYNEVIPAQKYLLNRWIPQDDIHLDYAWFDTYDSLFRAKAIFWQVDIIIFTQQFHLSRSIYIANKLWINVQGYRSDRQKYLRTKYYIFREFFSRIKAFWEVEITRPNPKYLGDSIIISYITNTEY